VRLFIFICLPVVGAMLFTCLAQKSQYCGLQEKLDAQDNNSGSNRTVNLGPMQLTQEDQLKLQKAAAIAKD
jgi:hypothetical protein